MKIQSIKKIATDGRHNAFTGLAFFKGRYFLVFRNGAHHAGGSKGTQLLLGSNDGEDWELLQNRAFFMHGNSGDQMDYRDSYFLNLGHELRLYSFSTPFDAQGELDPRKSKSIVQITRDGTTWDEPIVVCEGAVLWKPIFHDSQLWCAGYRRLPHPGPLVTELYHSLDGITWKLHAPITEGNEAALVPTPLGLRCFVRTNKAPNHMEIWESQGDLTAWEKVATLPKSIQAPQILLIDGKCYLFGREIHSTIEMPVQSSALRRTKAWKIEGDQAVEVLELPSKGDTSYVGTAMRPDGSLLLSYYSQHEIVDPNPSVDDPNSKPTDVFIASIHLF